MDFGRQIEDLDPLEKNAPLYKTIILEKITKAIQDFEAEGKQAKTVHIPQVHYDLLKKIDMLPAYYKGVRISRNKSATSKEFNVL